MSGDPHVIIGVLNESPNVRVLEPSPDVWIPFQLDPNSTDQGHVFQALGRLEPGVTLAQANGRMKLSADEFRRKGTGFRQNKARSLLVVAEMALALVLLVGSALLIRTTLALRAVNAGFDPIDRLARLLRARVRAVHFSFSAATPPDVRLVAEPFLSVRIGGTAEV